MPRAVPLRLHLKRSIELLNEIPKTGYSGPLFLMAAEKLQRRLRGLLSTMAARGVDTVALGEYLERSEHELLPKARHALHAFHGLSLEVPALQEMNVLIDEHDNAVVPVKIRASGVVRLRPEIAGALKAALLSSRRSTSDSQLAGKDWSLPMSKKDMMIRLGNMSRRSFESFTKRYPIKPGGSRQQWQICLDAMDQKVRQRLERP